MSLTVNQIIFIWRGGVYGLQSKIRDTAQILKSA